VKSLHLPISGHRIQKWFRNVIACLVIARVCISGGGQNVHIEEAVGLTVTSELEAEAKADLKVRLCAGPEFPERAVHNVASVKNYRISEVHSKDHSFCDAAFSNRADIQDRVV